MIGQQTQVKGQVLERYTKDPVTSATVLVGGTRAFTDYNGRFSIYSRAGYQTLRISKPGYRDHVSALSVQGEQTNAGTILLDSKIVAL